MTDSSDSAPALSVDGALWLNLGGQNLGGQSRIALLTKIAEYGSINRAAKELGISYRGAWDTIDTMNNLAGEALVERVVGGRGGGGTRLTERGYRLIETYRLLEREHRRFLERLGSKLDAQRDDRHLLGRLGLRSSARNVLYGKVAGIRRNDNMDEVRAVLPGGISILGSLTHESTLQLGLAEDQPVVLLIKASAIRILGPDDTAPDELRNDIGGTVQRVSPGRSNDEVVIELPSAQSIASIADHDTSRRLRLRTGTRARACFPASAVLFVSLD